MRIAFVTDEFVTTRPDKGGLATYLSRMTKLLTQEGHDVEIFVKSYKDAGVEDYEGIRVERVPNASSILCRFALRVEEYCFGWYGVLGYLSTARKLARALEARHEFRPFDVVQSSNTSACGLFIKNSDERLHIVRLSSHRGVYHEADLRHSLLHRLIAVLERKAIQRADLAYAPSQLTADHCRKTGWRHDVHVVRPPAFVQIEPAHQVPMVLPQKFLIHFGHLRRRKSTDVVLKALQRAWKTEPEMTMILLGNAEKSILRTIEQLSGDGRLMYFGPKTRDIVYHVLNRSIASVLPSRTDNLPNTVIESLLLGIPVIGSRGTSIEELIEPGISGELIEAEDIESLSESMVQAWRGVGFWGKRPISTSKMKQALDPEKSVTDLVKLIRSGQQQRS